MEILGLIDIPLWLIIIVFIIFTVYMLFIRQGENVFKGTGIKGPPGRFLYINSMFKKGFEQSHKDLTDEYGPVVGAYLGQVPAVIVTDLDIIKQVCVKEGSSNFVNRLDVAPIPSTFRESMQFLKDDHWKFVRGVVSPSLSTGKMKDMVPLIHNCCEMLVKAIEMKSKNDPNIDVKQLFASYSMDTIASVAFGIEINSQENPDDPFNKHAAIVMNQKWLMILNMITFIIPPLKDVVNWIDYWPGQNGSFKFFVDATQKVMDERRNGNESRKDLIELMLKAQSSSSGKDITDKDYQPSNSQEWKERGLTDSEIQSQSMIFFLAGYETVSSNLSMASYALVTNPECQEKLIQEIDEKLKGAPPTYESVFGGLPYLDKFFCEVLRMYPPAQLTSRQTSKDITINGYMFKRGFDVHIPVSLLHHSPDHWTDPEKFDPERFTEEEKSKRNPYSYIPFGVGPRNCVAQRLAIMETRMALVSILQKYRVVKSDKSPIPIEITQMGFTKPKEILYLQFEKRS
ncbi:hypothetical protein LOTGIDRAFT_219061 [Lottia gigantea]|uniref:Cytochrome P450 n=1 Tax=Lottia gigantea TaxID=225164 RepID=V4A5K8_LOTGI|nr:hypothetical protein LOTGIDRAFT_219061 [Lottia gigantea]ESO88541.1 hypothetical protein LOTGIDRAFT_219061 [Lottia gigantea]